jgi:hypothetical protein
LLRSLANIRVYFNNYHLTNDKNKSCRALHNPFEGIDQTVILLHEIGEAVKKLYREQIQHGREGSPKACG